MLKERGTEFQPEPEKYLGLSLVEGFEGVYELEKGKEYSGNAQVLVFIVKTDSSERLTEIIEREDKKRRDYNKRNEETGKVDIIVAHLEDIWREVDSPDNKNRKIIIYKK